jgi:cyclic-di-GMP phosphodiesterase TipF (flagellum assembly factor)
MAAGGRRGTLLSTVSADALMSERIVQSLAGPDGANPAATRVVLSFAQNEVRLFGQAQWATLADLADLGFRFSLEQIVDLDMDFEQLRNVGFVFTKVDAVVLLDGLPAEGGVVPAADLCKYLAQVGLAVIVSRVDDQALLARIQSVGAPFAQGAIFGPAQPVDTLEHPASAAA